MKLARVGDDPEIFHSIQGEGRSSGMPSVFIRASLCNLHCIWCDTDYTWNWENTKYAHAHDQLPGYKKFKQEEQIIEMGVTEIAAFVSRFECDNYVFTGGEPLLHQEDFTELMSLLSSFNNCWFEVETNGTIVPSSSFDHLIHQYNVSIKLSNSANDKSLRLKDEAIAFFAGSQKSIFKFVISNEEDFQEVDDLMAIFNIPAKYVYIMPEGRSEKELDEKLDFITDGCLKRNFNLTDRLHIRLFGDKRGV